MDDQVTEKHRMVPWSFTLKDGSTVEVTQEHIDAASRLVEDGWYQVSRKFRKVARLPKGQTGIEALVDAEHECVCWNRRCQARVGLHWFQHATVVRDWAKAMGEVNAGDYYLRLYSSDHRPDDCRTLDLPTFAVFRKLDGGVYDGKGYRPESPEPETVSFEEAVSDPFRSWPGGIAGR